MDGNYVSGLAGAMHQIKSLERKVWINFELRLAAPKFESEKGFNATARLKWHYSNPRRDFWQVDIYRPVICGCSTNNRAINYHEENKHGAGQLANVLTLVTHVTYSTVPVIFLNQNNSLARVHETLDRCNVLVPQLRAPMMGHVYTIIIILSR